jgi:hypothetical protein
MNSTPTPSNIALSYAVFSGAMIRKLLGIAGQEPSDSQSSRLHVDNFPVLLSFLEGIFFHRFL